jgi:signal peptidase I
MDGERVSGSSGPERDLRGTWPQALGSLAGAILLILGIRWAFFEPYVIPSGSMIPTLLVHDHILVNKFSYGVRVPFTSNWLMRFGEPGRGDVIVFRSVDDASVFLVKRVVGLPGDEILIRTNGQLLVNGEEIPRTVLTAEEAEARLAGWPEEERIALIETFEISEEVLGGKSFLVMRDPGGEGDDQGPYTVPENSLFMMGDNRDHSSDSRSFGAVPVGGILGRASLVWLSCEETLQDMNRLCDPKTIRKERILERIR